MQRRKIIAGFILLIGVGFFSYSFFSSPSQKNSDVTVITAGETSNDSRFQFTRNGLAEALPSSVPGVVEEKVSNNLTDRVANLYTGEIIKANKNDSLTVKKEKSLTLPSQDIFDATFDTILKEPFRFISFTKGDVLVSPDNSSVATRAYFLAIKTVVSSQTKNPNKEVDALNAFFSKQDSNLLVQFNGVLSKNVDELLKMRVPSDLVLFHLQTLNTFQKKLAVYSAIADMNADPVKTVVAIDEIPKIAGEIKDISAEVTKHI